MVDVVKFDMLVTDVSLADKPVDDKTENVIHRAIHLLGETASKSNIEEEIKNFLVEMLNDEKHPGRRSAAASELGNLGYTSDLAERIKHENNNIVLSIIWDHVDRQIKNKFYEKSE